MGDRSEAAHRNVASSEDNSIRREKDRTNARLRHFRGIAASVMNDASRLWEEIWNACEDPRSCEEILDGVEVSAGRDPRGGWPALMEKLHLLGIHIDYARRLCEGSIEEEPRDRKEDQV